MGNAPGLRFRCSGTLWAEQPIGIEPMAYFITDKRHAIRSVPTAWWPWCSTDHPTPCCSDQIQVAVSKLLARSCLDPVNASLDETSRPTRTPGQGPATTGD